MDNSPRPNQKIASGTKASAERFRDIVGDKQNRLRALLLNINQFRFRFFYPPQGRAPLVARKDDTESKIPFERGRWLRRVDSPCDPEIWQPDDGRAKLLSRYRSQIYLTAQSPAVRNNELRME